MRAQKIVFLAGLHRSGTSILFRCLRDHPAISGFRDTGVPEDEGQHLQTVYPTAKAHGGPGRFGFDPSAALDEHSPLATRENAERLRADWGAHWDLAKPVLLEKSPPNLIRTRFLQALFPDAYFVVLLRHPIATSYATRGWTGLPLAAALRHWLVCHERFEADRPSLRRVLVLHYEQFAAAPDAVLDQISAFLGVERAPLLQPIRADTNDKYFARWRKPVRSIRRRFRRWRLVRELEPRVARFGYSLRDLERVEPYTRS